MKLAACAFRLPASFRVRRGGCVASDIPALSSHQNGRKAPAAEMKNGEWRLPPSSAESEAWFGLLLRPVTPREGRAAPTLLVFLMNNR